MRHGNAILGMLILGGILIVNLPSRVYGHEGHHESGEQAGPMEGDDSAMLSPVWHKILEIQKELNEAVELGELESVHELAFEIRDLSKALLPKTTDEDLSEEQMINVKDAVGRIAEAAAALDEYGDAGDKANTVKELKKFDSLIDFIQMQYPESEELEHQEGE